MSRGRQWKIKNIFSQENGFYLQQFLRLVNENNQYEQATGSQERYYMKISNFTLKFRYIHVYKKMKKKSTLSVKNYMQESLDKYSSLTATVSPGW